MAEDTRPDADFSESAPKKPKESMTPVADAIKESVEARKKEVGDKKEKKGLGKFFSFGDSTKTILLSIEKSMFLQTEFLESINTNLKESNVFDRESAEDAKRAEALSKVNEETSTPTPASPEPEDKTLLDKIKESFGDLKSKASDAAFGKEEDGFFKKFLKTGATILGGGLLAAGFTDSITNKALKKAGVKEETADKVSKTAGDSVGVGTSAGLTAMALNKFGLLKKVGLKVGGLKAFATAAVAKVTYDAIGELDVDDDGKILGIKKELVQGIGGGLAGIATFMGAGKAFGAVGTALKVGMGAVKSKLGASVKAPKVKIPGVQGAKLPSGVPKTPTPKPPTVKALKAPTAKLPSATTITTSGRATAGRPQTVKGVAQALTKINPVTALKYAKFFKIGAPLAAVIPALIEPAMAIYNDEPDSVIRKQTAGALGSIGGAALGTLAGGSLGTMMFPGLGSAIGGGIGGLLGALSGEWLIEKITGALFDGEDLKENEVKDEVKKDTPKSKSVSSNVGATISDGDMGPTAEQKVADAQVKADDAGKALSDFESSAKSARTVQKEDAFGDMVDTVVYDDAAEQAQFDKLSDAKFDADYAVEDATNKMITGDEFDHAGMFAKLRFLNEKGLLVDGVQSRLVTNKGVTTFVDGPHEGKTPDEVINEYVKANSTVKPAEKPIPKIEPDMTKPKTADGKIPAKVTPATAGGFANATATGDDMGLSVEEAEKQLADAKAAFAQAEEDGSISEGFRQDELQADIQFAEKDLADANARAAASGDFVKRKPEASKGITQVAGIEGAPDKLMAKSKAISEDQSTKDKQASMAVQNNINKGGDTTNTTTVGGNTSTVNIVKGGGASSLANAHLPVPQAI